MLKLMPPEHKEIIDNCIIKSELLLTNDDGGGISGNGNNIGIVDQLDSEIIKLSEHNITIASTTVLGENIDDILPDKIINSSGIIRSDDDSESLDSIIPEEDPNDPEWQNIK